MSRLTRLEQACRCDRRDRHRLRDQQDKTPAPVHGGRPKDAGRIHYGEGYSALSTLAARNMPTLGKRLDGVHDHTDDQYRAQVQLSF